MQKITLIILLLLCAKISNAQTPKPSIKPDEKSPDITVNEAIETNPAKPDPNKVYGEVDKIPEFPGGYEKFKEFVSKNIKGTGEKGKVYLSFNVEKDGSLTDIKAVRGLSAKADTEAVRILRLSPKWQPGIKSNSPVRVSYSIPVIFN